MARPCCCRPAIHQKADQAGRGVGPERERLLAARVALDAEVGPGPPADRGLGREACCEALRVELEVAVEVEPRRSLPDLRGLVVHPLAHLAAAVGLHDQPPLAVGVMGPKGGVAAHRQLSERLGRSMSKGPRGDSGSLLDLGAGDIPM